MRERPDRCPGVLRPWPADDGALVRIRIPGGRIEVAALRALVGVAEEYGDRLVRVTGRANLQVRGLPSSDDGLPDEVETAIEATGLLPSRAHDLARNVLASPQTGLAGGRADLRPVVAELDRRLLADQRLTALPGRFLLTVDDGRGDLADRHRDLGVVALDAARVQLRVGSTWGPVVALDEAAASLVGLAHRFLDARGTGPTAAWHVDELGEPLLDGTGPAPGADVRSEPLPFGPVAGGSHEAIEDGIDGARVASWTTVSDHVVVTPWHGVLVPTRSTNGRSVTP